MTQMLPVAGSALNFHATLLNHPDPNQKINIVIYLRIPQPSPEFSEEAGKLFTETPSNRKYLTHTKLEKAIGASPEDVKTVDTYMKECGLKQKARNRMSRTLSYEGTVASIEKAFNTTIATYGATNQQAFLSYSGALYVPADLQSIILRVTGITIPVATEFRKPTKPQEDTAQWDSGYFPMEVAKAYNFPGGVNGKGQTIAVIELGGQFKESDFKAYFKEIGIKEPVIEVVGTPSGGSMLNNAEVTLDIEVIGAIAPGAKIVVYFAPTILEAMKMIIADTKNKPIVVSCSWAGPEKNYNASEIQELNMVFYEASLLGMTVIAASGDHGAYYNSTTPDVAIPSSSPLVVGCGGTTLELTETGTIQSEVVWNEMGGREASGGGFSDVYPLPNYQQTAWYYYPYGNKKYTRGVPDIAANASSEHGYKVVFNGVNTAIGGTSAATPVWAALIALMNESLGYKLGYINPYLYSFAGSQAYRQITMGNNLAYYAAPYWNPCCGLGSPDGQKLMEMFKLLEEQPQEDDK